MEFFFVCVFYYSLMTIIATDQTQWYRIVIKLKKLKESKIVVELINSLSYPNGILNERFIKGN